MANAGGIFGNLFGKKEDKKEEPKQPTAADKAKEADGSKALDAAIELFSGREITEVNDAKERLKLKEELVKELDDLYEGEVMDVYFTQFVSQ